MELNKWRRNAGDSAIYKPDTSGTMEDWIGIISMLNREEPDGSDNYSWTASQFRIDLSKVEEDIIANKPIEGIHEWKFEFITKVYNEKPNYTFTMEADYIDNNDQNTQYQARTSLTDTQETQEISFNQESINKNYYDIPEILKYTYTIENNNYNAIQIEDIPGYNYIGLYYYLDSRGLYYSNTTLSKTFKIKINGYEVELKNLSWTPRSVVSGQITPTDPIIQKFMKKTDTYNDWLNDNFIKNKYRNTTSNPDGDYYWIV